MARTALPGRLTWQVTRVVEVTPETGSAKTILLEAPDWAGHRAGQHVDIRLTAEDGYQAQRSYSIASAPEDDHLALTVEEIDDGEVSPYLTEELRAGDELELRGPIGGWFVWEGTEGRPAPAVRRRLGRRAPAGDAAPPRRHVQSHAGAPRLLGAVARGRHLPRGAAPIRPPASRSTSRSRGPGPRAGPAIAAASTTPCSTRSPGRRARRRRSTSAGRPASSRRSAGRWSRGGTPRGVSRPSDSDPRADRSERDGGLHRRRQRAGGSAGAAHGTRHDRRARDLRALRPRLGGRRARRLPKAPEPRRPLPPLRGRGHGGHRDPRHRGGPPRPVRDVISRRASARPTCR